MITVPTTLVIGAGASKPWGLPTAKDLIQTARSLEGHSDTLKPLRKALALQHQDLEIFLNDLREDPTESIDVFLETKALARTREIGRALIAMLLGQAILDHRRTRPDATQDWLAIVIEAMRSGARSIDEFIDRNRLRFVTFNFDSIVEDELTRRIKAIFKVDGEDLARAVAAIPIVHVHGQLPPIHSMKTEWLQQAANRVRVVHDEIDIEIEQQTREAVAGAQVICFLGFSFHPENLKRLEIKQRLSSDDPPLESYACTFGMPNNDRLRVEDLFRYRRAIHLAADSLDCAKTLRQFYVLKDES